jgi:DNA polymerase
VEAVRIKQDVRRSLTNLKHEWETCRRCSLGVYREDVGGSFVFGEGSPGGIMFIGEGPGKDEEEAGRPFIGDTGQFLRKRLELIGLDKRNYYLANAVCCRSWKFQYDGEGKQRFERGGAPTRTDEEPLPVQREACRERLLQQIYIVDPVLIVTLGVAASETLIGKAVGIQAESGKMLQVTIPGAGWLPDKTSKGTWMRRDGSLPVVQNQVVYNLMPLIHPSFAIRNWPDKRKEAPMPMFMHGLRRARDIYFKYMQEAYGESMLVPEGDDESHDWDSYEEENGQ